MSEEPKKPIKAKNYLDYMKVRELTQLQHPLSDLDGALVHDEHLFIIMHQTKELWFLQIIKELEAARTEIQEDNLLEAAAYLNRCRRIVDVLVSSWEVLATLHPREFWRFRQYFGTASGLQSAQFRQIEFILGLRHHVTQVRNIQDKQHAAEQEPAELSSADVAEATPEQPDEGEAGGPSAGEKETPFYFQALKGELDRPSLWDEVIKALARRYPFSLPPELLDRDWAENYPPRERGAPGRTEEGDPRPGNRAVEEAWLTIYGNRKVFKVAYRLGEALYDLAYALALWRHKHILTVQRFIGDGLGSGGTFGVRYLTGTLRWRPFPELWSIQNRFSEFEMRESVIEAVNRGEEDEL
jgi:tryptophan 2,3-dioxygenase